jgi:hypothetical protein
MVCLVLRSKLVHTDDTPVPVQDKGRGKTRAGRIWVYVGDEDHPYTVFDYTATRSRDGPAKFLSTFRGYLQADAYAGYDAIYAGVLGSGDVVEVACWAHTRRYFFEARLSDPGRAHCAIAYIRKLYDVEDQANDQHLESAARGQLRQQQARPILDQFEPWLKDEQAKVLPKSPIGQAISYTLSNWQALVRYTQDGDLHIDNNIAENALRALCLGRKNWLFFGSDRGGETAAVLFSLIASCQRHGIDPYAYLRNVIGRISDHPANQLTQLLPDHWQAAAQATPTPSVPGPSPANAAG